MPSHAGCDRGDADDAADVVPKRDFAPSPRFPLRPFFLVEGIGEIGRSVDEHALWQCNEAIGAVFDVLDALGNQPRPGLAHTEGHQRFRLFIPSRGAGFMREGAFSAMLSTPSAASILAS